ncbi:tryptophan 7-halogenase [Erythrobacter sp. JK5]|uniref:tryptophan 7-halogenase n=1 Tax=Erythrobacter sp. JK5 TaxID=2829500 RepID=UPI001BACCC85|nr:tryptophan 7-halogenase [Erythrobacter sp. JK5]QUL37975.1 tryptophan 7-halogenase [Erythrobacter sp. JK5]
MSEARPALDRIAVAGDGQVGVLAALALKRALPACEITVVGLAPDPAAFADHAATALPFTNKLHDRLGIREDWIVARAGGSHRLVTRCFGWGEEGQHGPIAYGASADPLQSMAFGREWGGGSRTVTAREQPGSLAETLAGAGRFRTPPPDVETPLAEVDYALRWVPSAYRALLIELAQQLGVRHVQARSIGVETDGAIGAKALAIEGGSRIEADLFLDCSGPAAHLLRALPTCREREWSDTLPTRRVLVARPGGPMLALEDRISLLADGWLTELAGRDGLHTVLGVGERVSEAAAMQALASPLQYAVELAPARVAEPWIGNVIAIGDASARFEPLGWLNLDLAHRQLALLLELLPGKVIEPLERAEYNRRSGMMMDTARDTLALFYAAPRARRVFASVTPQHVSLTIDQFTRRGRLPFREESPLFAEEQMALLRAVGFERGTPPQFSAGDPRQIDAARQAFSARAQAALDYAPPYQQWLASVTGATG